MKPNKVFRLNLSILHTSRNKEDINIYKSSVPETTVCNLILQDKFTVRKSANLQKLVHYVQTLICNIIYAIMFIK